MALNKTEYFYISEWKCSLQSPPEVDQLSPQCFRVIPRKKLTFPCGIAAPPSHLAPSLLSLLELLAVAVCVVVEAMMAAAGCGSATAAAGGGQGGTATARGRFPGRPWSSRSRLRSEKRWQLGRSGLEADDVTNGGPRPTNLALSLNEDQSHLRLLGIEASHKILGQAGYSSSGSEEVRPQTDPGVSIFISSSHILCDR